MERITVKEIAGLAGYNRSTFYQYYTDTYAVREEIEGIIFQELEQVGALLSEQADQLTLRELLQQLLEAGAGECCYLPGLLMGQDGAGFEYRLSLRLKELFGRIFTWEALDPTRQNYIMEYHIHGILGVVKYAMRCNREPTVDEIIDTLSVVSGKSAAELGSAPFSRQLRLNRGAEPGKTVEKG